MDYHLVLAFVGIVISLVAIYLTLKSNWNIAKQSGAFKVSNLDITISGVPVINDTTTKLLIGIPIRDKKPVVNIGVIPLHLNSTGDKTIKNIVVSFAYTKTFDRKSLEALPNVIAGPGEQKSVKKTFSKLENYNFATYTIKSINPSKGMAINEPIYLNPNLTHACLYDNHSESITFSTRFTSSNFPKIEVSVSAEDFSEQKFTIEIIVAEVKSRNDLINVALKRLVTSTCDKIRKNSSFFHYFRALIVEQPRDRVHIVFPKDVKQFKRVPNQHFYLDKPWVKGADFSLATWWRLIFK